jgi:hypothetical protein
VFDGPPEALTEDALTLIYGEEDWTFGAQHADNEAGVDEHRGAGGGARGNSDRKAGRVAGQDA